MKSKREVCFFRRPHKSTSLWRETLGTASPRTNAFDIFSFFTWLAHRNVIIVPLLHTLTVYLSLYIIYENRFHFTLSIKISLEKQFSETKSTKLNATTTASRSQQQLLRAENFSLYWFLLQLFILISNVFVAAQSTQAKHQWLQSYTYSQISSTTRLFFHANKNLRKICVKALNFSVLQLLAPGTLKITLMTEGKSSKH